MDPDRYEDSLVVVSDIGCLCDLQCAQFRQTGFEDGVIRGLGLAVDESCLVDGIRVSAVVKLDCLLPPSFLYSSISLRSFSVSGIAASGIVIESECRRPKLRVKGVPVGGGTPKQFPGRWIRERRDARWKGEVDERRTMLNIVDYNIKWG
ncbi:hypothetical protein M422DRAFT_68213 [Sphaerobolus stellatus SS14]|uniref:Uncharacterized protein n=1 Tax=Sphaerobolus stellatus (strain SS14) TaxID=990650 RepID=A0A0C9VIZ3_SPHS4|nr:hypothetical protein M422DRAFT_68213 [Sphaerobolus stellatus SS14]